MRSEGLPLPDRVMPSWPCRPGEEEEESQPGHERKDDLL